VRPFLLPVTMSGLPSPLTSVASTWVPTPESLSIRCGTQSTVLSAPRRSWNQYNTAASFGSGSPSDRAPRSAFRHQVLEPVAVHVHQVQGMGLGELHAVRLSAGSLFMNTCGVNLIVSPSRTCSYHASRNRAQRGR